MPLGLWARTCPRNHVLDWGPGPSREGAILGERLLIIKIETFCHELCRTDRFAFWVVDSTGPKEAQVQLYSLGGANVPRWKGTLAPPGEYDWTVRLRRRCGLTSNYLDHLFQLAVEMFKSLQMRTSLRPDARVLKYTWTYTLDCLWNCDELEMGLPLSMVN